VRDAARVPDERSRLLALLESQYRASGWPVTREREGLLKAAGADGVSWYGRAVTRDDMATGELAEELRALASERMPGGGELCVLDLLPAADAAAELERLLADAGLADRPNVSVYSLVA